MILRLVILCLSILPLFAEITPPALEHTASPVPSSEELTDSYQHAFGKMLLSLGALVVLLFATIFFLKRLNKGKFRFGGEKSIDILERKALSQKTVLYLIKVDGKKVLISESQLEVRPITSVDHKKDE